MPDITKVTYGMTIGDLKYGNQRPGVVEATLKPGETMEDALDELDERLTAWHKKRYPHFYEVKIDGEVEIDKPTIFQMPKKEPEDKRIAALIADIYSCAEIKILESYKILVKSKPELQAAYDQRMHELIDKLNIV